MSGFTDPTEPNVTDYLTFLRNSVGIGSGYLPDDSMWITTTFDVALAVVNTSLAIVPLIYCLAVYNLAADRLINFATDVTGSSFFRDVRSKYDIAAFAPGVLASSADQGTSSSWLNTQAMSSLTLGDLQNLRTPWGRQYLAWAQAYGPNIWGLS